MSATCEVASDAKPNPDYAPSLTCLQVLLNKKVIHYAQSIHSLCIDDLYTPTAIVSVAIDHNGIHHHDTILYMGFQKTTQITLRQLRALSTRFQQISKDTFLRYIALALLISVICATLIAKTNGQRYANTIQSARSQTQNMQDAVNSILEPKDIELGQQDLSIDYILSQTNPQTMETPEFKLPSRLMVAINLLPDVFLPYSSFSRADDLKIKYKTLVGYQYDIFSAAGSALEYNPRADFADKTLNEEEIKLRIDNARKGLADAIKKLGEANGISIEDPTKTALVDSIEVLQKQLEAFSSKRDYEAWFKAVEDTQKSILNNRQLFWEQETGVLFGEISRLNQDLATIEQALRK